MLLLAFHIIAIGALVMMVGWVAYRMGARDAEQRATRQLERDREDGKAPLS